jgi:hypothetical protein
MAELEEEVAQLRELRETYGGMFVTRERAIAEGLIPAVPARPTAGPPGRAPGRLNV